MKKKSEKVTQSEELKKQLATVSTVILSTFQGITVEQDTQLRRSVEAAGGKYQVVKNTVAERAGAGTPPEGLLKNLKGTNSIAYTKTDPVALAKILTKVAKDVPAFQFRADADSVLAFVAITMPPWPGMDEAVPLQGPWAPTIAAGSA